MSGFWRYKHINVSSAAAIVISSNADCLLHGIVLNQQAGSSTVTMGIYSSTASVASTATAGLIGIAALGGVNASDYLYDVICENGLSVMPASGIGDITVIYR